MSAANRPAVAIAPPHKAALAVSRVAIAIQLSFLGLLVIGRVFGGIDDTRLAHNAATMAPAPILSAAH